MSVFIKQEHLYQDFEKFKNHYVKSSSRVLEIGPSIFPRIRGKNVKYADICDQETLKKRFQNKFPGETLPEKPFVDYVCHEARLPEIIEKFDIVYSGHCIEHQLCLIRHLEDIYNILNFGGHYLLTIPDKRYCFDHFLSESTIADVLEAYYNPIQKHSLKSVIEHRSMVTHNNAQNHWSGKHGRPIYENNLESVKKAIKVYQSKDLDVHKWQFHPNHFEKLYSNLFHLGYAKFELINVYNTMKNKFDFNVVLRKAE